MEKKKLSHLGKHATCMHWMGDKTNHQNLSLVMYVESSCWGYQMFSLVFCFIYLFIYFAIATHHTMSHAQKWYLWYWHGVHVMSTWCACDTYKADLWYSHDAHVLFTWFCFVVYFLFTLGPYSKTHLSTLPFCEMYMWYSYGVHGISTRCRWACGVVE